VTTSPNAVAPSGPGSPRTRGTASLARVRDGLNDANAGPIWLVLLSIMVVSWALTTYVGGDYLTIDNLTSMVIRSVALGIVAMGQTVVILAGSLDLSVAYLISVAAVATSLIQDGDPGRMILSVLVVLGIGVGVGLTNGLIITKLRVNPFIATLGVGLILRGVLNAAFDNFAGQVAKPFETIAYGSLGPVPWPVILLGTIVAGSWVFLRSTRLGLHVYAVGGNADTARLSGIRSHRVIISAHVLCSLAAVVSGMFLAARIRQGAPWIGPDGGYDLESIAAVVVGGTALAGGRGGVIGTLAGVLILAVLDNLFNQLQFNAFLKLVVRGVIIIAAVAFYAQRERRAGR
jgi:ribose/xylose/arabinose/galactoside ABC-type transport system permease subunit